MADILKACNVVFRSIIHYPDITIKSEQTSFLQGKSGCGKSTLLKLFNGTLSPDSGDIYYDGTDITSISTIALRQEVLLVGQTVYLFHGTVENNFRTYYEYRNLTPISPESMRYYLDLCCADFPLDGSCDTMSGGERQRVYIAIFISFLPKVLMMDEPTSALDQQTSYQLMGNVKEFCASNGITLLVISHDIELAKTMADHIITLEKEE